MLRLRTLSTSVSMTGLLALALLTVVVLTSACSSEEATTETSESPANVDGLANTLKWVANSETGNAAFLIFRATHPDGPFERVNEEPIPGAGTTDEETSYEYIDDSIATDTEYFYYIESVAESGARERISPILRAAPKTPATEGST